MILGMAVLLSLAGLFYAFAWLLWKKQKISLVHDYHRAFVKKENVAAYTKLYGKAMTAIGTGILLTAAVNFVTDWSGFGWLAFAAGFIVGIVYIVRAQRKYNK